VIELARPSDQGSRGVNGLARKKAAYIANGTRLAWLLDPQQRSVEISQAGGDGGRSQASP
jgi:Uma2 family endonuclease